VPRTTVRKETGWAKMGPKTTGISMAKPTARRVSARALSRALSRAMVLGRAANVASVAAGVVGAGVAVEPPAAHPHRRKVEQNGRLNGSAGDVKATGLRGPR
jgi:hypothetical protein